MSPRKKSRNSTGYRPAKNKRHCDMSVFWRITTPERIATRKETNVRI